MPLIGFLDERVSVSPSDPTVILSPASSTEGKWIYLKGSGLYEKRSASFDVSQAIRGVYGKEGYYQLE